MLRQKLLRWVNGSRMAITATALLAAGPGQAQSLPSLSAAYAQSAKDKAQFATILGQLQQAALAAADSPQIQTDVTRVNRAAETIANPAMQQNRDRLLRFLGINPQGSTELYIFVSWSMPLSMLRAYEIESMWTGAPLVFRGIPKGTTLKNYILKDLRDLVWGKGSAADVTIDPRLFDLYSISSVPTLVLSKRVSQFSCTHSQNFSAGKAGTLAYTRCATLDPGDFIKLEGAVTTGYALRQFEQNGWPQASVYLAALRKGYTNGMPQTPQQTPFSGKWSLAPFPKAPGH